MVAFPKLPPIRYPQSVKDAVSFSTAIDYAEHGSEPYRRCAETLIRNNAGWFVTAISEAGTGRNEAVERCIKYDPMWSCVYAETVIGGRFVEAERCISSDPVQAVRYAKNVKRGRFYEAERTIATCGLSSLRYARYLGVRFPLGEAAIIQNERYLKKYLLEVVRKRNPLFEDFVRVNGPAAVIYATLIVQGRWDAAETVIREDPALLFRYSRDALKGPLPPDLQCFMHTHGIIGADMDSVTAYSKMCEARGWRT